MTDQQQNQYGDNPFTPTEFSGSEYVDFTKPGQLTTEERIVRIEGMLSSIQPKMQEFNASISEQQYGEKYGKNITWINEKLGNTYNNLAVANQSYASGNGKEIARFSIPGDTLVPGDGVGPSMYHFHLEGQLSIATGTIVFFTLFADETTNLLGGSEQLSNTSGLTMDVEGAIDIYFTRKSQVFSGVTDPDTYIEFNARYMKSSNSTETDYLNRNTRTSLASSTLDTHKQHSFQLLASCSPPNTANMVIGGGYCERLH